MMLFGALAISRTPDCNAPQTRHERGLVSTVQALSRLLEVLR
jgi:hypothetical protein